METSLERRRLNDELERVYMDVSFIAAEIEVRNITDRGVTWLDVYEKFHKSFNLLIMITSVYPQMRKQKDSILKAYEWIKNRPNISHDTNIRKACDQGVTAFKSYAEVLSDQGVFVPPNRG